MSSIRAQLCEQSFAPVQDLHRSWSRNWQDRHNDAGTGSIRLQNDDPHLAACTFGRLVRFDLNDAAAFPIVIEQRTRHSVKTGEEAEQYTQIQGRGTLALWEDLVVYPDAPLGSRPFGDDRLFGFMARAFNGSAWPLAVTTSDTDDGSASDNFGNPPDWPDPTAEWIWDRSSAGAGVSVPVGDVYFRHTFSTFEDLHVELRVAADDAYEVWLDGTPMLEDGPLYVGHSKHVRFNLTTGLHLLAVKATNRVSKGGLYLTVMRINGDGSLGTVVTNSGADWQALGYPAVPPGFTPGHVLRVLLEEAKTRGVLADMALGFTDALDSDGAAWTVAPDVAFKVGLDGLSVLRQLAETYIDVAMAPDALRLDAWLAGTRGSATAVQFLAAVADVDPNANLTELVHEVAG